MLQISLQPMLVFFIVIKSSFLEIVAQTYRLTKNCKDLCTHTRTQGANTRLQQNICGHAYALCESESAWMFANFL